MIEKDKDKKKRLGGFGSIEKSRPSTPNKEKLVKNKISKKKPEERHDYLDGGIF